METTKESEFSKGIERFSQFILRMILVTLVFIFVANLLIKGESADIVELRGLFYRTRGERGSRRRSRS
ncbi:MAG: hypothetical protein M0C28_17265 [Candidatus Moduliflexus flocculans]|nr:hypothetical protein [Candidatus Moduliflexus flocculans]